MNARQSSVKSTITSRSLPEAPPVAPAPHKKVAVKQSKYAELPTLPLRGIVLAPSGGGGSTLMQWLILTGYRGLFSRIHIISPSIHAPNHDAIFGESELQRLSR